MSILNENTEFELKIPSEAKENILLPAPEILSYYEDKHNRNIWVLNEIGDSCYDWISSIIDYNREDKDIPVENRKPIKLIVSNYGGKLEEAKAFSEIIRLSKTPVYSIAIGPCASAATLIYLSCHKHFATKNAYFLFHRGSCNDVGGNYNELQQFMDDYKKNISEMGEFYKEHTSFPEELIQDKLEKGDWYVYIEEAINNGVVDEVINDLTILF